MQITVELLQKHRACEAAVEFVAGLLPVTVHEDMERNLEIAKKVSVHYLENKCGCMGCMSGPIENRFNRHLLVDMRWLMEQIRSRNPLDGDASATFVPIYDSLRETFNKKDKDMDPSESEEVVVARAMAWIAKASRVEELTT